MQGDIVTVDSEGKVDVNGQVLKPGTPGGAAVCNEPNGAAQRLVRLLLLSALCARETEHQNLSHRNFHPVPFILIVHDGVGGVPALPSFYFLPAFPCLFALASLIHRSLILKKECAPEKTLNSLQASEGQGQAGDVFCAGGLRASVGRLARVGDA